MTLIIGGAYQGKLAYAQTRFDVPSGQIFYCSEEDIAIPNCKTVIYGLDRWILALIRKNISIAAEVKLFMEQSKNAVVICNDISCGVVPTDPVMRKWREETGRALGVLAQNADEVIRLFCGIPTKLK
ncbi:MAG: bifunctional adenosylcobinamide kinase/adenosylcobinamide-phosphate guanylyltransferase [Firmicutes bacterium]|nr:bifunctional adenosylcobinamide kinase/adenosylcobinamide-phosphate guanylyltransferase [Bacillota bacterium]